MNTSMDILGVKYEFGPLVFYLFGPSVKKFGPSVFYLFGPPDSVYRTSSNSWCRETMTKKKQIQQCMMTI